MRIFLIALISAFCLPLAAQSPEISGVPESLIILRVDEAERFTPEAMQAAAADAAWVDMVTVEPHGGEAWAGPSTGDVVLMSLGGVVATGLYGALTMESDFSAAFWLSPLVGGATTFAIGEALGHDGDPLRTLGASALASVPGAALLALVRHRVDSEPGLGGLNAQTYMIAFVGYGLFNTLPVAASVKWHTVTPSVQRTPTGETVPGLSLSVGL